MEEVNKPAQEYLHEHVVESVMRNCSERWLEMLIGIDRKPSRKTWRPKSKGISGRSIRDRQTWHSMLIIIGRTKNMQPQQQRPRHMTKKICHHCLSLPACCLRRKPSQRQCPQHQPHQCQLAFATQRQLLLEPCHPVKAPGLLTCLALHCLAPRKLLIH